MYRSLLFPGWEHVNMVLNNIKTTSAPITNPWRRHDDKLSFIGSFSNHVMTER